MGIIASFVAALLATGKDIISKRLAFNLDGTVSAFASFLFALPFYLILLLALYLLGFEDFAFSTTFFILVVLRALTDSVAEWAKMHALARSDISYISAFLSLSPLFLLITSPLITGDKITLAGVLAIFLIVGGTLLLVYKPGNSTVSDDKSEGADANKRTAIFFALISSLFFSLNACFDRLAVQVASPALSGFAMTLLAALFLLPPMFKHKYVTTSFLLHWRELFGRGFLEVIFMVSKLFALQFLQAPYVAGISKSSLLLSIIGGKVIFKEKHFWQRFLSGTLILVGIVIIVFIA